MAFIRKRGQSHVVGWRDKTGKRRDKSFRSRQEAVHFLALVNSLKAIRPPPQFSGEGGTIDFYSPVPRGKRDREKIIGALRAKHPWLRPTTSEVIVHVLAEMPPSSTVADVDNLLKPVLDALAGVAYVNDTQVVECLVRKVPSPQRRLRIKLWFHPPWYHAIIKNRVAISPPAEEFDGVKSPLTF